jgi:hypothetical protein
MLLVFKFSANTVADLSDYLADEIKGPATFQCKGKSGCTFQEPNMNDLIDQVFGDPYITLKCEGGECLHISQVPGYVVSTLYPFVLFSKCFDSRNS